MNLLKGIWRFAILVGALSACTPVPSNPVNPPDADCDDGGVAVMTASNTCPPCKCPDAGKTDAGPIVGDLADRVCNNLRDIKCSEGTDDDCAVTVRNILAHPNMFKIYPDKLVVAKSIADARVAGAQCR